MAWPFSPLTTYIAASTPSVSAADLNAIQAQINVLSNTDENYLRVDEDFLDSAISTKWTTSGCTITTVSGATGNMKMTTTAGTESLQTRDAFSGTSGDFSFSVRVSVPTKSTATWEWVIAFGAFGFTFNNGNTHWITVGTGGGPTSILVDATYRILKITRVGTLVTWYIDGVSVLTAIDSSSLNTHPFVMDCGVAGGAGGNVCVDSIKFWCAR